MMAQVEEVKKILRSLLVSAPVRVTVKSLNRDFNSLEGYYIPHREFGYNSLLHFLHSIPDVLRVNGSSMESEVTLVITEKVAHVSDMVMKQKRPSKGKNARAPTKSVIRAIPTPFNYVSVNNANRSPKISGRHNNYDVNQPTTSDFKNVIKLSPFPRAILSSNDKGPCFTKYKPQDIQGTELNFDDPIKMVESDNSKENDSGTSITNSDECERVPSLSKHMAPDISNDKRVIEKYNAGVQSKFEKLKRRTLGNKNESNNINSIETKTKNLTLNNNKNLSKDEGIISIENNDHTKVPLEIQNKLKKLIKQNPSGIRCIDLPAIYKKMFLTDLEYQKYGFDRLISLCINLENIFYCEQESDCDYKLYDIKNPPLKKNPSNEEESEIIKSNITVKTVDLSQIKAVKSKDWEIHLDLIPPGSLNLGDVIETNLLNEYIIGDTIQIVISEIFSPSKFWIYKSNGQLNEMMNYLQNFYRENKKNYVIPEFLLEIGLYCVVYTLNEFQRALIIDLLQEIGGYVKVYLIDYGTLANLPREKVWFLSKEFCNLPSQAVETNLAGIQPKEGNWSMQSILRFKDMVASKHIFAKIIDKRDDVLSIHIAVSSMPLQTLNDLLVLEGYAEYMATCELQGASGEIGNESEEKNPRKKFVERRRMKNQIKGSQ